MRIATLVLLMLTCAALLTGPATAQTAEERRDRGLLQAFIEDNLSEAGREVRIEGFRGALSSRATLDRLTIADDEGVWLVLENAALDWNRSGLLQKRLEVNELTAERLVLPRLPVTVADDGLDVPTPEAEGFVFALPDLPVSINVAELRIDRAEIGAPVLGDAAVLSLNGSASLEDGEGDVALAVTRLDETEGRISVDGSFSNTTQALALAMEFVEGPGGIAAGLLNLPDAPAVELTVAGDGTLSDFTADIELATNDTPRISGTVSLGALPVEDEEAPDRIFAADIDGDLAPLLQPEYRDFVGDSVTLDVRGVARANGRLELEQLDIATGAVILQGALALGEDGWPERIDVVGRVAHADGGEVLLAIPGEKTWVRTIDLSVVYDADADAGWSAAALVDGLRRADLAVASAALTGEGTLTRGDGVSVGAVDGTLDLDISGIALDDPALMQAVGETVTGALRFAYVEDAPLDLSDMNLTAGDVVLTGSATASGFALGEAPTIVGNIGLDTADLSRFAPLTGQDLQGAAGLKISGRVEPLGGIFDLTLEGSGEDLAIGNAYLDALITGEATLGGAVSRTENGVRLEDFRIATPATDLTATARIATGDSAGRFDLIIADASVVEPRLAGPVSAEGTFEQTGETWTLGAALSGPGDLTGRVDGTIEVTEDGVGDVTGIAELALATLDPYSGLAGTELAGALDVTVAGRGNPGEGTLEASVMGFGSDLAFGIEPVDAFLDGEANLVIDVVRSGDGRLEFREALFETPQGFATLTGALGDGQSVSFDIGLTDLALYVPELPGPATAQGVLSQTGNEYRVTSDIAAPGGAGGTVSAEFFVDDTGIGPITGSADLSIRSLAPYSTLANQTLGGGIDLRVNGSGDISTSTFEAEIDATAIDLSLGIETVDPLLSGETLLSGRIQLEPEGRMQIEGLKLENAQLVAEASGRVGPDGVSIAYDTVLTDIGLLIAELQGRATARGVLTGAGEAWQVRTGLTGPGEASGTFNGRLTLIDGSPATVNGTAEIGIGRLSAWSGLAGRPLAGAVAMELAGEGDLRTLTGQLDLDATGQSVAIGIDAADRILIGESRLALEVSRTETGAIDLSSLALTTPVADLQAAGTLGNDGSQLSFDADVTDMRALAPTLSGAASFQGTVSQDGDAWSVVAGLSAPGGVSASIDGTVQVLDGVPGRVSGTVDLDAGDLGPYAPLVGQPVRGGISLNARVSGDLVTLTGDIDLTAQTQNFGLGIAQLDQLLVGSGTVALEASRAGDGTLTVRRADIDLPRLTADLSGSTGPAGGALTYDVRLADLGIFAPGFNGPATAVGTARSEGSAYRVDADLTAAGGIAGRVAGLVQADGSSASLSLDGSAPLALANRFITPNLVAGRATFNLALNGPLALSSLSGTVSTRDASFTMPSFRLRLSGIDMTATLSGGRAQISASAAVATGGRVTLSGPITLSDPFSADLTANLVQVRVVQPGLYETTIDGSATLTGPLTGGAMIAGVLNLGSVELRIPSGGGLASVNLPNLVHEQMPASARRTLAKAGLNENPGSGTGGGGAVYGLDITVNAPNRIFIRGRGLDAEVGGSLRLTGTTANVVTQGGFQMIRGRVDILGERLTLTEGSVRLQGDFDPFIRLVAITPSGDVQVTILIEGLASSPELSITSEPELPEEEILARLIFKRGLGEISPLQAVQLAAAIQTLSGGGGTSIVERLRKGFGLDDLDITTDSEGKAAVQVGKYVSENVYTGVQVNSAGETEINLNLRLTPSLTARGSVSSDGETGIGVYFEQDY